jgi:hypothetical protein
LETEAGLGGQGVEPAVVADLASPAQAVTLTAPPGAASAPVSAAPLVAAPRAIPGVGETISGAFDLALTSSRTIRRASVYIGLLTVALAGPAIVVFLAIVRELGGPEETLAVMSGQQEFATSWVTRSVSWLGLSAGLAFLGVIAVAFEAQILAMAIVGGAATSRPIGVRAALRLSRRVFWLVLVAAVLVAILERVVTTATEAVMVRATDSQGLATTAMIVAGALVTMPFGYYQAGIVLGEVGPGEALKRSTWITRARWRLAILVASAGVVLSIVEIFALGAGLDLVARLVDAAGLGLDGSAATALVTVAVVLACVVAVGSLVVTIAALVVAPQVFVFLRITGYSVGLDRARPAAEVSGRPTRLVTRPMLALIGLTSLAALAGLLTLWS